MDIKKILILPILLLLLAPNVYAESLKNFDQQYVKLCEKPDSEGLTAYICSLRNENNDLKGQNEQLRSQIEEISQSLPHASPLFVENFEGTSVNPTVWNVLENGGSVVVENGSVTLDSPSESAVRAPFMQILNVPYFTPPTDPSHVIYEWRLKYNRIGAGMGLILTTGNVDTESLGNLQASPYIAGTWTNGFLYNSGGTHFFASLPTDAQYHTYKVSFHGFYYYYYFDGELKSTGRTFSPYDISSLFIGTPSSAVRSDWSSISVDYFKVTAPTFLSEPL